MTKTADLGGKVILYGAGNNGRKLAQFLRNRDVEVMCFLDRRAAPGQTLLDVPVIAPTSLSAPQKDVPVVISLFNRDVSVGNVISNLKEMGFKRLLSYLDLHEMYTPQMPNDFWLTRRSFMMEHRRDIERAASAFADEQSRDTFRRTVAFRESGDFTLEPAPDLVRQYFPADIQDWPGDAPLRFVDCGAYIGDSIMLAQRLNVSLESVAAFEPDPENFRALGEYTRQQLDAKGVHAMTWPCGVSDSLSMLSFSTGEGEATKATSGDGCLVQCVALDDVVYGMEPNLIKMDVEGSEIKALAGAKGIIERFRPALAISIYHEPQHLWEIPLLVKSWDLGYTLHVRSHGYLTFDTILYAVPPK